MINKKDLIEKYNLQLKEVEEEIFENEIHFVEEVIDLEDFVKEVKVLIVKKKAIVDRKFNLIDSL